MMISSKTLLQLPVLTKSGLRVGRVVGFEFEVESQTILRYKVQRSLLGAPFLVGRQQVVSISEKEMVVDDLVVRDRILAQAVVTKPKVEGQPTALNAQREQYDQCDS